MVDDVEPSIYESKDKDRDKSDTTPPASSIFLSRYDTHKCDQTGRALGNEERPDTGGRTAAHFQQPRKRADKRKELDSLMAV